jgi:hypothetical protein
MKLVFLIAALAPAAMAQVRVEPRQLVKEQHLFVSGGVTWLERNDYWVSPGATLSAVWYPAEDDGIETRLALFSSHLDGSAQEVADKTGLQPDSQAPQTLLLFGWRHSLTYGKVALASQVVHFDVQSGLHLGSLITDKAATPAASGSLGLVAKLGQRGYAQLDLALLLSLEQRSSRVLAGGFLPLLTFGWSL